MPMFIVVTESVTDRVPDSNSAKEKVLVQFENQKCLPGRTSQEGGNAPAVDAAGARYACPLPDLFLISEGPN